MSRKPVIAILADFPLHLVNPAFSKRGWHSATWLVSVYEMLKNNDTYEVHWIRFQKGIHRRIDFESGNQNFHVLPAYSLSWGQKTAYLHARIQMKCLLRRIKPDVVHAWGTEQRYAACAAAYKGKNILSMQGVLTAYVERAPMPDFVCRQARYEKKWFEKFSLVTSESEWGIEMVRGICPGVTASRWEYAARDAFFKTERQPSAEPICLFGGTDTPVKDLDSAIAAFSSPELAHVQLWLAGVSAEARPNLPPNIKALGGVGAEEMVKLMSQAWCLVHPSLADTSPNIVKEARVMGLPAVVTTECGGKQYIEQGKSGFIIKSRDVQALRDAVLAMTRDRETSLAMGAHGREECRRLLSKQTMYDGLMELYERVLHG